MAPQVGYERIHTLFSSSRRLIAANQRRCNAIYV
jgi:hypothetical protein